MPQNAARQMATRIGGTVTLLLMTVLSSIGEVGPTESILELGISDRGTGDYLRFLDLYDVRIERVVGFVRDRIEDQI